MNAITRLVAPALVASALVVAPSPASAVNINYCDFSSTAGLSLNWNASKQGSVLQLTPNFMWQRGSAFTTAQFPFDATTSFHTYFSFRATPNAPGADGLVFVIQSGNATAIGNSGLGIGYEGIASSVAVEFDTYQNGANDPGPNHVALLADGTNMVHIASAVPGFPIASDKDKYAWIDYDAATQALQVYLAEDPFKPATPLLSATFDIAAHLGPNVRAGFTAATGGVSNTHAILEWQMSTDGFPCCTSKKTGACNAVLPACGANGLCVKCVANSDCSGDSPICQSNVCMPCAGDTDCEGNPAGSACSPTGACVGCTSDASCGPAAPTCDTSTNTCVGCVSNLDCALPTPACDPATKTCVGCLDDSVCPDPSTVCDVKAKQCVTGCHVVGTKDTCGDGMMCDKQDGTIGTCHSVGTSSSGMASSSSTTSSSTTSSGAGGGSGGAGGAGGTMTGSGGGATMSGGAGGSGGSGGGGAGPGGGGTDIAPGGGCACGVGANGGNGAALAAVTLLAALGSRRRKRSSR